MFVWGALLAAALGIPDLGAGALGQAGAVSGIAWRAQVAGEASRRRVAYLPFVEGPRRPKTEESPTPLYHYLQRITG